MRGTWIAQQHIRCLLGGCAVVSGFILGVVSLRQNSFVLIIGLIAMSLAALVGAGKLASP